MQNMSNTFWIISGSFMKYFFKAINIKMNYATMILRIVVLKNKYKYYGKINSIKDSTPSKKLL